MEFGWINLFGAIIIVLILIPNIIYAVKHREQPVQTCSKAMVIVEQIGRYACISLMWLPLLVWKFGFNSVAEMFAYIISNGILLALYYVFWLVYFGATKKKTALILAILPTCIFLVSGILLHHWLLVISAVLFGIGHIHITSKGEYSA